MSEPIPKGWGRWHVGDLIEHHFSGPSPTCEERNIQSADEWGVLKTTAVVWEGWNEEAHKVLPRSYWGQSGLEVHAGDVLVTKAGPRHRVGVVVHVPSTRRRLIVSGKLIGLRVKNGICYPDVLAGVLALKKPQKYLDDRTTGMAESQVNFANKALLQTPVTLPPPREQQVISKIKGALDAQIRQTEVLLAKLKRIKQGLLTDLLTRGIDQNGQLRPTPDHAPHLYEDSPLGQIPQDWECRKLFDLVKVRLGFAFSSASYVESGLPSFRVSDIGRGSLSKNELIQLPKRFWDQHPKQHLFGKEIVIVMVGATTGKLGRVPPSICPALQNQNMWRLEPTKLVRQEFLYMLLPSAVDRHMRMAQGSARDFLSQKSFLETTVACAPLEEQERAEVSLLGLVERIQCESKKLMKLKALKIGLMDDLLTGSVRVTPLLQSVERATA